MKSFLFILSNNHLLAIETKDTVSELMEDAELNTFRRHASMYSAASQITGSRNNNIHLVQVSEGREDGDNYLVASFKGYLEFEINSNITVMDWYSCDVMSFLTSHLEPVKQEAAA